MLLKELCAILKVTSCSIHYTRYPKGYLRVIVAQIGF
jgi:hypothetical protein